MSKKYFPAQGQKYSYLQTNRSDSLGSIWSSFNLDFQTDLNTLRVAPRMLTVNNSSTSNFGMPIAFSYIDSYLWTIAGTRIFRNGTSPNSAWTVDASTGNQTNYSAASDLGVFNNRLWATTATNLYSKALDGTGTGAWTSRGTAGANPNLIKYFPLFNRLYWQDQGGRITSIDTNDVVASDAYIIDFGSGNQVTCMQPNSDFMWLGISGLTSVEGSVARIYAWDGISAAATKLYTIPSRYVLAMCVYQDIIYLMDGNGILYKFNGYGFGEIGRLPFPVLQPLEPSNAYIHRNGMRATKNGTIEVMVSSGNSGSTTTYNENMPAGVWEWSEQFGFTHKFSVGYTSGTGSTITDFGQNIITLPGAIFDVSEIFTGASGGNGTTLVGATYVNNGSGDTGLFVDDRNDTLQKKGYFVTTWFFSDEVQDKWTRLWAIFRRLIGTTDSIVLKYRITEIDPLSASITWVNTTSFTTTTDPTAYWQTGQAYGGEVEILQGTGSGSCAHITNIVNNAGTYTVTIDTAITGVTTGAALARFQHWVKVLPAVIGTAKVYEQMAIGAANPRIQIKGCLTFTGPGEFYKFAMWSNEDIKVNP